MQTKITFCFIGFIVFSLVEARPQTFNNYPFRPTFADLDPYNLNTTPMPYTQNDIKIWPYIVDQAVSPLYNLNQGTNGYLSNYGSASPLNIGFNTYPNTADGTAYNPGGYITNSNAYTSYMYSTLLPYLANSNVSPLTIYGGKK